MIESGCLALKHTDIGNGVRIQHEGKVIVRRFHVIEYHLPKHFLVLVYMVRAFYRKSWSVGDCFAISIPTIDCSVFSSSPVDSLYVIEVHCKRLPTSGSGRLLAPQILMLTSLSMNPVLHSSPSHITFILTTYSLEGLPDFRQQNLCYVPDQ